MGSVVGCTRNFCLEKNTKEINVDLKENIENINTINTNKNEQTKSAFIENDNERKSNNNSIEEEEKEDDNYNNDNDNDNGNGNDNDNENEEDEEEEEEENNEDINQYKKELSKIILIQKAYKQHHPHLDENGQNKLLKKSSTKLRVKFKDDNSNNKYERFNTTNFTNKNNLKKSIHKYDFSMIHPEKKNNEENGKKEDEEEIISVEQPFITMKSKQSSKLVSNLRALEVLKSSLLQNPCKSQKKQDFLNIPTQNHNYLRILSDFGDRRQSLFKNSEVSQKNNFNNAYNKLAYHIANKEKKEARIKKNQDNIKGNFILKNEKVIRYQGGFIKKTKKKNGFGIVTWSDNSTLLGTYISSTINGIARFYNNKYKSTFIGEYENNIPKGFGVYYVKSLSLQGYWDCSNINGIAIEVWEDGTYFQGEYENNKKNGVGLYRWPDGTIYQGEFNNGQMTGRGIILYSDDSIFSGEMLNGYMNGYGIFSWGNGALYMGYYLQDIKHGFGIYVWDSKMFICYIGFWEMGKQQGIGAKINGNKIKYCIWNKGKISTTLKGLYEIDRYLTGVQKGYYQFFTAGYISKLRASSVNNFNQK